MKNNGNLKNSLVLQSFAPLFFLLFIKHFYCQMPKLAVAFFKGVSSDFSATITRVWEHPMFWDMLIVLISTAWIIATIIIGLGFCGMQHAGFRSAGEMIVISEEKNDVGITFLVSFVFPLLVDDVTSLRDFLFFASMLTIVVLLLIRSNLFYQNPILSFLGYRIYRFKFSNPASDIQQSQKDKEFIGITHGKPICIEAAIKRKYIADDVFMIYND